MCDDGNHLPDDGCSSDCLYMDLGFSCDGLSPTTCVSICGDGILTKNEDCDDGNLLNGDGCSDQCQVEKDWECSALGLLPYSICTIECKVKNCRSCKTAGTCE